MPGPLAAQLAVPLAAQLAVPLALPLPVQLAEQMAVQLAVRPALSTPRCSNTGRAFGRTAARKPQRSRGILGASKNPEFQSVIVIFTAITPLNVAI